MSPRTWSAVAVATFTAAILGVLLFVTLKMGADLQQAATRINYGQEAIVCILAIPTGERTHADVEACLAPLREVHP